MSDIVGELLACAESCGSTVREAVIHNLLSRAALEIESLRAAAHALQRTPQNNSRRPEAIRAASPSVVARDLERLGWVKYNDTPLGTYWRHAGVTGDVALPRHTADSGYCTRVAEAATAVGLQQDTSAVEVLARWFRESAR